MASTMENSNQPSKEPKQGGCRQDCVGIVNLLLDLEADINVLDERGYSPLCAAIEAHHSSMIQTLVSRGADVNLCTSKGISPIYLAALAEDKKTVRLLADLGARPSVSDLFLIGEGGTCRMMDLFFEAGIDLNEMTATTGISLLRAATEYSNLPVMQKLLESPKVDIEARDSMGCTPLHIAVCTGSVEMVRLLLDNGACINSQDIDGATPLYLAQYWLIPEIPELLMSRGARL